MLSTRGTKKVKKMKDKKILKGHALAVFETLSATPNMAEIMARTGMRKRQVEAALALLRAKGYHIASSCFKIRKVPTGASSCPICAIYDNAGSI